MESLEGAASEHINHRYNNCANRAYYAAFQATVHALETAGFTYTGRLTTWSHDAAQATFVQELITRRKVYAASLRDTLSRTGTLRDSADYGRDVVSETQATRALGRAREFVQAVIDQRGTLA